jgi:hypothetical protein
MGFHQFLKRLGKIIEALLENTISFFEIILGIEIKSPSNIKICIERPDFFIVEIAIGLCWIFLRVTLKFEN